MDLINSAAQYGLLHGTLSRETHVYKGRIKSKRFTNESKIFTAMIFRDETENVPSPQPNRPLCQDLLTFGNLLSAELKALLPNPAELCRKWRACLEGISSTNLWPFPLRVMWHEYKTSFNTFSSQFDFELHKSVNLTSNQFCPNSEDNQYSYVINSFYP